MRLFSSPYLAIFGKCSGEHSWNATGVCERCGAVCRHPAWLAKWSPGECMKPHRGFFCMDCGTPAEQKTVDFPKPQVR